MDYAAPLAISTFADSRKVPHVITDVDPTGGQQHYMHTTGTIGSNAIVTPDINVQLGTKQFPINLDANGIMLTRDSMVRL